MLPQSTGDGAVSTALEDAAAPAVGTPASRDAATTSKGRLEFLDALRGIAALVVAVQHLGETQWVGLVGWSHYWLRLGEFGVLVFFLCSGFIIPASMERRNDLVEFWIGRFFRLWPLYLAVVAAVLAAWGLSERLTAPDGYRVVEDSLLNLSMLQVFTTRPLVVGASWTLGYELVFYLLVSALFVLGLHRSSATTSVVLLVSALALGGTTTVFMVQRQDPHWWTFPAAGLLLLLVAAGRVPGLQRRVAFVAMGAVVVVALANRPHGMYFSLLLLGFMFVGTVLYRWTAGQLSGRTAAAVYALGLVVTVLAQYTWHVGYEEPLSGRTPQWWTEALTFVAAYLLFGGALLLRHLRWPRVLVYLGTISYSVYLLHALVLVLALPRVPGGPWANFALLLAITLGASALTYRFVERPGIALGRRVVASRRARTARRTAPVDSA